MMRLLLKAFALSAALSFIAAAQPTFLPLNTGNSWTLKSPFVTKPITITTVKQILVGPERWVELNFDMPWYPIRYTFIPESTGIRLSGMAAGGNSFRLTEPVPFFSYTLKAGQSLENELATVTVVSTTAVVTTPSRVFTDCRLYRVAWNDGAIEDWILAPTYGFVQYGTFAGAFIFEQATITPYVEQPPVTVPSPCPVPGVDANPDSGRGFGEAAIRAGLAKAHAAGARLINIDTTWSELEPAAGSYNFTRVLRLMKLAEAHRLQVMLNIATVDTFMFWTPPDLASHSIADPVVRVRFQALLERLAPQIRPNVKYVHLANEVDIYLSVQPRIDEFRRFFSESAAALKQLRPELSIGLVSAYNNTRRTDAIFQAIKDLGDHTAFTYYPLADQYAHRQPTAPAVDVPDMVRLADGRPVVLTEIGYSSSPAVNGSNLKQQEFYRNVFAALKRVGNRVAVANFLFMNELPAASVTELSQYYGPNADPRFIAYVGTLGLHDHTGAPKAAWAEFSTGARQMLVPNGCSRQ